MERTSRFKSVFSTGKVRSYGEAKFPVTLALSIADADKGLIGTGKPMMLVADNHEEMAYADGQFFQGFLNKPVGDDTLAIPSCNAYVNNTRNSLPAGRNLTPEARGRFVGLAHYPILTILEFEGKGAAGIGTFVATTGTGAIADTDVNGTQLALVNGSWIKAAAGAWIWAHLMIADLTPENAGEVRIRIKMVSPYIMPV